MNNRTFKFVFSKKCMDELEEFTKTHISEERIQFKKSWLKWTIEDINQAMILNESLTLLAKGCQENIINKMFLCVRFYLKKKKLCDKEMNIEIKEEISVEIKTKHVSNNILSLVNNHIKENLSLLISPANLYKDFSMLYEKELSLLPRDIIKEKKTYKNRYYIMKNGV
jgi:hypothetical protein